MPLLLFCACGHSGPMPEEHKSLACTKCGKRIEVCWFSGDGKLTAWQRWQVWRLSTRRVLASTAPASYEVKFVAESAPV